MDPTPDGGLTAAQLIAIALGTADPPSPPQSDPTGEVDPGLPDVTDDGDTAVV